MKPGNWPVAPKLRRLQAYPVRPRLALFGGGERAHGQQLGSVTPKPLLSSSS